MIAAEHNVLWVVEDHSASEERILKVRARDTSGGIPGIKGRLGAVCVAPLGEVAPLSGRVWTLAGGDDERIF